jgi:hypothetical protein
MRKSSFFIVLLVAFYASSREANALTEQQITDEICRVLRNNLRSYLAESEYKLAARQQKIGKANARQKRVLSWPDIIRESMRQEKCRKTP